MSRCRPADAGLVRDATGTVLNTSTMTLPPEGHQAHNIYTWVNRIFSGSVQIVSTVPIVSLSLNFEASTQAALVVSSLPPGDLDSSTLLSTGH